MYVEKDEDFNLLYVGFRYTIEKGEVATTKEPVPGAYFDLDPDGKLVGIEIVNTEQVLGIPASELRLTSATAKPSK
jgi:uncharacterized protein YuzE